MTVLKVSKASNPHAVAGAIAGLVRDHGSSVMQAIGPPATNQAVKAIAIARSFMREEGIDLLTRITFLDVEFGGETRTALRFTIADARNFPEPEPVAPRAPRERPRSDGAGDRSEPAPAELSAGPAAAREDVTFAGASSTSDGGAEQPAASVNHDQEPS